MMKKIVSIFLLSQFLFSSAFAGSTDLKRAFDELTYALTVEWDQKDPEFSKTALKNFSDEMSVLRSEGLTDQEMAVAFKEILGNRQDAEADEFIRNLSLNNREQSVSDLRKLAGLTYQEGASYVPVKKILIGVAAGAAVIFVAGLLMWELSDPQIFDEDTEW